MEKYTKKQQLLAEKNFLNAEILEYGKKNFIEKCGAGFLLGAPIGITLSTVAPANPATALICMLGSSFAFGTMQFLLNEKSNKLNEDNLSAINNKLDSLDCGMEK